MRDVLDLGELHAEVTRKAIKHVHLSVLPPTGKVRVAAPESMPLDTIRLFVVAKLGWIRSQQRKLLAQERETVREFLSKESHYLWGKRYLLEIQRVAAAPTVEITPRRLVLKVRPNADRLRCEILLDAWYRQQVRGATADLLAKWEPRLHVKANQLFVQRMKTKWGGCTPSSGTIRLNTELVRKPKDLLEYVVVHEMMHLLEPTHSPRFFELMSDHYPSWPEARRELNELPLSDELPSR